ncbi:MAG: CHAT domain-containing protein [Nostocaceae cyanobacterium]|nr:CHAT domain-containing protein [Nostocaceae cyanobacterium]
MTQEFHISVTPVGNNYYLVRTEQVAPGVPLAEELLNWPVDKWLATAGHLMNDPLKSVLQGNAMGLSTSLEETNVRNSHNLLALGEELYKELFQGTLRDSLIAAQSIAQNHQDELHLRLGLKDANLARLPWEVMNAGDRPVATGPYVTFSRYQTGITLKSRLLSTHIPAPGDEGLIKVLMVIASPTDQVRLHLLTQEAIKLQDELQRQPANFGEFGNLKPHIQLTVLEQPGREELTQALEQGQYHILHYSGHSNVGAKGGEIYLVNRRTGLTETLSGDDLAGLLVNNEIQMAVFNSCLGAYAATSNATTETGERNLTESLIKRGVMSVLAMSERIPDEVAVLLTQLFYRNLSLGYSVDVCVTRMRQGLISAYGSHQMYWALPILYLQPGFDGYFCPGIATDAIHDLFNEYDPYLTATPNMYLMGANDGDIDLPSQEVPPSLPQQSSELDWLGEDSWDDLLDEIQDDDPAYADDSAMVADLLRHLQDPTTTEVSSLQAELVQSPDNSLQGQQNLGELAAFEDGASLWGETHNQSLPPLPHKELAQTSTPPETQQGQSTTNIGANQGNSSDNFSGSQSPAKGNSKVKKWTIFGIVGASSIAAILGVSWWWENQRLSKFADIPPIPTQSSPNGSSQINLKTAATAIVTAHATEKLSQGDLEAGLSATEELLKRNVLPNARIALAVIPTEQANDARVNFLKGRLAWQSIQLRDRTETTETIDDARRYWENAVKADPESILYSNALGFAYYAEDKLNRANDFWFKAIRLADKQQNTSATNVSHPKKVPKDTLTAYAGLAIGLYKSSEQMEPGNKRDQYLNKAVKLRQMVLKGDKTHFQLKQLSQNWLWSEQAIADWKSLLEVKS